MPNFQTYNIVPTLPAALEPLREISFNVWWTWEPSARRLFRHLDPELWNRTNHNPVRMLQLSRQARLEELATDKTFLRELKQVYDAFQKYLARKDTYGKNRGRRGPAKTGGLFLGRIRISRINPELFRRPRHSLRRPLQISQRSRPEFRRHRLALSPRLFPAGDRQGRHPARRQSQSKFSSSADPGSRSATIAHLLVSVRILDREVCAKVWELHVGRINLYLLDTDIPENNAEDRLITAELYGGDLEMRMRQEIVLGIGGVKALERARDRGGSFSHERRPLRLSRARADSAARRGEEARFLFRPSGRRLGQCFHHPHAGARRATILSRAK